MLVLQDLLITIVKRMSDRYYKLFGKSVSQLALQKRFTKIKKRKRYEWLKDINAQVPKQASKDFDTARKIRSKSTKMVLTLLINPKRFNPRILCQL